MTPRQRFIMAVTVISFLTVTGFVVGCDSEDTPTYTTSQYGSIGFGPLSRGGYTWNFQYTFFESDAQSQALAKCRRDGGTACQSLEFGQGQCGALAVSTGTTPVFGVASRSEKLAAQNAAIASCRSEGGANCRIADSGGRDASICLSSS